MHEYELDDETLQKAQLEQHKIFQKFPPSPAPAAPNAPPLPAGTNPELFPFLEPNDSNNDSPKTFFDTKTGNAQVGTPPNQIIFEMLTGTRQFDTIEAQTQCPPLLHEQLKTVAFEAWDRITPQGEPTGSYTKILQGLNESYADFLARLETAISRTVIGEETKKQLEKLLAYENTNQKCQKAIFPIHETGTINDYLKACHNLRSETQKMQMLVETMAATFRKGK